MTITKTIKIIAISVEVALVATLIALCIAVGVKNRTIKTQKVEIANLQEQVDSLARYSKQLAAMDAITVNCTFNVNNKNIFSVNTTQANQIAKTFAEMTRQEVLDSLYKKQ